MQLIIYSLMKVIDIKCHGMKEKYGLDWSLAKSFINTESKITAVM